MPTFEDYVEVEAEMDISPKEFVQACDEDDIEELIEALQKNKFYKKGFSLTKEDNIFDLSPTDKIEVVKEEEQHHEQNTNKTRDDGGTERIFSKSWRNGLHRCNSELHWNRTELKNLC